MLAAVSLSRGADALVSTDKAFSSVPELRHVEPGSAELDDLFGAD